VCSIYALQLKAISLFLTAFPPLFIAPHPEMTVFLFALLRKHCARWHCTLGKLRIFSFVPSSTSQLLTACALPHDFLLTTFFYLHRQINGYLYSFSRTRLALFLACPYPTRMASGTLLQAADLSAKSETCLVYTFPNMGIFVAFLQITVLLGTPCEKTSPFLGFTS
jgi:hypothetical protein